MTRSYQYYPEIKKRTVVADPATMYTLGGHNELIVQPNIMVQSMTNHTSDLTNMAATGSQVIQIIKLTHDNIKKMRFMASITTATSTIYDTFDYADDTALRAVWTSNATARIQSFNDKTIVATGTSSMRMTTQNNTATNYYIQKDLGSATNLSSATYSNLTIYVRKNTTSLTIKMSFIDTDNLSASTLLGATVDAWTMIEKSYSNFTSDQATATDFTKIRYIRFTVVSNTATNQSFWVDQMVFVNATSADNLHISLYDCGAVEPTSASTLADWTILTSDQGNTSSSQTVNILNAVGHNTLELNDTYGCTYGSTPLTIGNYVAVVFSWAADNITVAGYKTSGTAAPYTNGQCFYSADSGNILTVATATTARFTLYSVIDCTLKGFSIACNAAPKASTFSFHYDDHFCNLESFMLRNVLSDVLTYSNENVNLVYEKSNKLVFYVKHDNSSSFLNMVVLLDIEYTKDWE